MEKDNWEYNFSDLYTKPEGPFNMNYARACEINFGMTFQAARMHHELMQNVPDGFSYHGKVPNDHDLSIYPRQIVVIGNKVYNGDGNEIPGYVAIAMKIKE